MACDLLHCLSHAKLGGHYYVNGSMKEEKLSGKFQAKSPEGRLMIGNYFRGQWLMSRKLRSGRVCRMKVSVSATFKDKDAGMLSIAERSETSIEEIMLFLFQLDLTTQIQRSLNTDQYEQAQILREKLTEVDQEIARRKESKLGLSSKDEAQDKGLIILRLRNKLQKAIGDEDYVGAATIRDQISKLEAESLAAAATALAFENIPYSFRLGQKVQHKKFGYRCVVCGMDPVCCESERWVTSAQVGKLSRGRSQPFYQVLVDMREDPTLVLAYVAEENLIALEEPDLEPFDHPYIAFLFYGMDAAGDFIPVKQLRDKYKRPRHELPWGEDNSDGQNSTK